MGKPELTHEFICPHCGHTDTTSLLTENDGVVGDALVWCAVGHVSHVKDGDYTLLTDLGHS